MGLKEKLFDFDALDEVPCPPKKEHETFSSQVDLEAPFPDLEADEFESNNNVQNEPNENDSEPEKVQYCFEALWGLRMTEVACVFNLIT